MLNQSDQNRAVRGDTASKSVRIVDGRHQRRNPNFIFRRSAKGGGPGQEDLRFAVGQVVRNGAGTFAQKGPADVIAIVDARLIGDKVATEGPVRITDRRLVDQLPAPAVSEIPSRANHR